MVSDLNISLISRVLCYVPYGFILKLLKRLFHKRKLLYNTLRDNFHLTKNIRVSKYMIALNLPSYMKYDNNYINILEMRRICLLGCPYLEDYMDSRHFGRFHDIHTRTWHYISIHGNVLPKKQIVRHENKLILFHSHDFNTSKKMKFNKSIAYHVSLHHRNHR